MSACPPITAHAIRRAKERLGLNKHALARAAVSALAEGVKLDETRGTLQRYLEGKVEMHPDAWPRLHGYHVFIFGWENALITVWELPHEFRRAADSARAKRQSVT